MRSLKSWLVCQPPLMALSYLGGWLLLHGRYLSGIGCLLTVGVAIGLILHREGKGGS